MKYFDRVKETTTTTGTGAVMLGGAVEGFRSFGSVLSVGDKCAYCIAGGAEWEVGIGTYSGTNTLSRTTVLASSNSNALVDFSSGTKEVFITILAHGVRPTWNYPDTPSVNPHEYDEEFDGSAIGSAWSMNLPSGVTATLGGDRPSWLMVKSVSTGAFCSLSRNISLTGAASVTIKYSGGMLSNYMGLHVILVNASWTDGVAAFLDYGDGVRIKFCTIDSGSWNYDRRTQTGLQLTGTFYVHLQRDASDNWILAFSYDGYGYYIFDSYAKTFTAGLIYIDIGQFSPSSKVFYGGLDWVRFNWLFL